MSFIWAESVWSPGRNLKHYSRMSEYRASMKNRSSFSSEWQQISRMWWAGLLFGWLRVWRVE
jgi:hypothetical protein